MGKIKVLDTPSGRILKDLINAGVKLGISSRGLGSVKEQLARPLLKTTFNLFALILCLSHQHQMPMSILEVDLSLRFLFSARLKEQRESNIDGLFRKILGD